MNGPRIPTGRLWEAAILFTAVALVVMALAVADLAAQVIR